MLKRHSQYSDRLLSITYQPYLPYWAKMMTDVLTDVPVVNTTVFNYEIGMCDLASFLNREFVESYL